jgi:hypothetical protein
MTNGNEKLAAAARSLYQNLKADIDNASTRIEHIRLTRLTQEAENLVALIDNGQEEETHD